MRIAGTKINGIVFDVDGTLLDSMPVWENVANEFLLRKQIEPRENLSETFKTMSLEESAAYYQTQYGIKMSTEEIIDEISDMIREAYRDTIPCKPGVISVLRRLKEEEVPMCIATATEKELVELAFKRNGIEGYFKEIVTCTQVGASKESSIIYETAREVLQTESSATMVVEDALHAAETAKKAGFFVLGVYDKTEKERMRLQKIADCYVDSFTELEIERVQE